MLNNITSSTLTLKTGVPQGCMSNLLLYSLFTSGCIPELHPCIPLSQITALISTKELFVDFQKSKKAYC